ncbi:helicase-related protein [Microvirga sp. 0TCS3.31]
MSDLQKWYDFRQQMVDVLQADLMGGEADAVLDEAPLDRFVLGILHPQDGLMEEEDSGTESGEGGSGADTVFDPAVALSRMRYPSSMGMTFAVDATLTSEVIVEVEAARYQQIDAKDRDSPWHREPAVTGLVSIDSKIPGRHTETVADGLDVFVVVRPAVNHIVSITVVMINTAAPNASGRSDDSCWFQPDMKARASTGRFVRRRVTMSTGLDDTDLDSYELLYRNVEDLAVGHGCAVAWDESGSDVSVLRSTFLPWHDVKLAEPSGASGVDLLMRELGEGGGVSALRDLITDYRRWTSAKRSEIEGLPEELQSTAAQHLQDADEVARRIERGVNLLESDPESARAFRLMNQAMDLQRTRQDLQRGATPGVQRWRPFQMAFILLNLEGLTDAASEDRELADLLWFPTGGGKTEAYLGLIAYSILLRRLRNGVDAGVSVLMRYTLRLLTIQQFDRAAGLICALESIRRRELPDASPISLGLWVGQGATPNKVKDAKAAIRYLERGEHPPNGNPVQLLRCPVCGTGLGIKDYRFLTGPDRMLVRCPNGECEFRDGLPVHLVDEDVYRVRPSLVIGTVDKFAAMAWRQDVRNLFSRDGRNSQPDLIVQDELHLISGPLGTMVGLYEAAVDAAATGEARPKIVASTATIRRASQQVRAVFDREARQFPPPGLESTDSYFSVEAPAHEKGTRRYLGVLAPSVSHTTLMVRCYGALLQAAQDLPADDEVRDAYWTLLGYFNSLRVLGGAYMQVLDDVPDRMKVVATRARALPRELGQPGELTSRKDSSEIPRELQILETPYPDEESPDVVLATNMISVGVDVDRLGLMVVMGQPQTTAEYIQATSRVGRKHPGLVVVLYNGARSRDLSHYENFGAYHRALYRQVEATGATPFAARARDRGLHGMFVSMVRLMIDDLAADERAVLMPQFRIQVEALARGIVDRASRIAPQETDHLANQLDALVESWTDACAQPSLKYAGWKRPVVGALLQDASEALKESNVGYPVEDPAWPTMTSLRDVDATSGLYLVAASFKEK